VKVIAIGGNPGSGKSTLMKEVLKLIDASPTSTQLYDLVPGHVAGINDTPWAVVLGKYDEDVGVFGGTDKMSMAVQPKAIEYLATEPTKVVIFEGDRLFTASFLEDCNAKYELHIIHLATSGDVREERYKDRGSNQDPTWLKGRESKISNILTNFDLMDRVETFNNNNLEEQAVILAHLKSLIYN
jgi:uridine kinase